MESKIKEARKSLGLTQIAVRNLLGIPTRTQQGWEAGNRTPAPWLEEMVIREYHRVAKNDNSRG